MPLAQEVSTVPVRRDGEWPQRDHYTVLGVEPSASTTQITSAYRRLTRALHPDARPAEPASRERFVEVIEAYAVLRDPARRAAYDAERRQAARGALSGRPVAVRVIRARGPAGHVPVPDAGRRVFADVAGPGVTVGRFAAVGPPDSVLLRAMLQLVVGRR